MMKRFCAILLAMLMLSACAGPAKEPVAAAPAETVTVESCSSEVPEEPAAEPAKTEMVAVNAFPIWLKRVGSALTIIPIVGLAAATLIGIGKSLN